MGYTIYVIEKDKQKKEEIFNTLSYIKEPVGQKSYRLAVGDDLSYVSAEHKPDAIGFDYPSWIPQYSRFLIFALLFAVAKKYGKTCIYYDSEEYPIQDYEKFIYTKENLKLNFWDKTEKEARQMMDEIHTLIKTKII
jgi:hypothetical protein